VPSRMPASGVTMSTARRTSEKKGTSLVFRRFWRTGLYALYTRRLRLQVLTGPLPEHVGLIMDGNRRWARQAGLASPGLGHRAGAEHVEQVLSWCEAVGIKEVTVFICSTENPSRRADAEVAYLMRVIEEVIAARLARPGSGWQVHVAGLLDVLPDSTARALKDAAEQTRDRATGAHLTLAIGYGGRQEIVDAVRDLLAEADTAGTSMASLAERLTADDITAHLYTVGRPDPDLVIRTSGEQRMSNFLLWQSAYSELYFCEAYWPAFREIDFLRALRSYATRKRRFGS
jgi:short-chain Z-isoprenyl diphosphate synthase